MINIYYDATPPYEGPWYDEWGTEFDEQGYQLDECGNRLEESEEEGDEEVAGNVRQAGNGPQSKVEEPDEKDQTW